MSDSRNFFEMIPDELIALGGEKASIGEYLSLSEQYRASRVNKKFYSLFKTSASQYVQKFLNHAIRGNEAEVIKMLELDPGLLLEYGTAKDYSGRTFTKRSVLQLMLLAKDNEMIAAVKPYFDKLHTGQKQFETQVEELEKQLPNGFNDQPGFDFSSLVTIISNSDPQDIQAALNKQQTQSPVSLALKEFRAVFTQLSMSEENFNSNHLLNVFKAYAGAFDHWDWDKRDLFWRQVIGFVQRFLPSNIAQDFAQGIYNRVVEKEKSTRSFSFWVGSNSIYPLSDPSSLSGLGFDYAGCGADAGLEDVQTYVEQKHRAWKIYTTHTPADNSRTCKA